MTCPKKKNFKTISLRIISTPVHNSMCITSSVLISGEQHKTVLEDIDIYKDSDSTFIVRSSEIGLTLRLVACKGQDRPGSGVIESALL